MRQPGPAPSGLAGIPAVSVLVTFVLHPQLAADTTVVAKLDLCRVLLMEDARYPWLILVPQLADLKDLHQVPSGHQAALWQEINQACTVLEQVTRPYKLNVAALGNQVPQLHIHIIARNPEDTAWPGPVWGVGKAQPYGEHNRAELIKQLSAALGTGTTAGE